MPPSRSVTLLCGLFCIAAGLVPILAALGVIPSPEESFHAPRWVVFLAGSLFFTAGMWILLQALVGEARARAFGEATGVALLVGLAMVGHWVAFGPGSRETCGGGFSMLGFSSSSFVSEIECRAAFGYGAILMDFILLRGIAWWVAQHVPASRSVRAFEKATEWGFLLALLPLLLVVVLLVAIKEGGTRLAGRLRPSQNKQD